MAVIVESRYSWEGGCVRRIHEAAASLINAANFNIRTIGRDDCAAAQFGFPTEMMAADFRDKAVNLAYELLVPGMSSTPGLPPAEYPATKDLPIEVKCSLEWLASVFGQQMDYWGWGVEEEVHSIIIHGDTVIEDICSESDDARFSCLVYSISKNDLCRLTRCLEHLASAIQTHPPTKGTGTEALPAPSADEPSQPKVTRSLRVPVERLNGDQILADLINSETWAGTPFHFEGVPHRPRGRMYRSPLGNWVELVFVKVSESVDPSNAVSPRYRQITTIEALRWFRERWMYRNYPPERGERIHADIIRLLLEAKANWAEDAARAPDQRVAPMQPKVEGEPGKRTKGEKRDRYQTRSMIVLAYHKRCEKNQSLSVRAIADEVHCSPSYVSKIIAKLGVNRRDEFRRGYKDEDGGIEAVA